MFPHFTLFGIPIQTYGLCTVLGAATAILWCLHAVKKRGLDTDVMIDLLIYAGIGALIGSKVLFLLLDLPWIISHLGYLFSSLPVFVTYLAGGFIFYGGLIGLLLAVLWYACRHPISLGDYLAAAMPAFPLFHIFGRIGCFLAGCCYGMPSDSPFAMPVYTLANPAELVSRIPVPLYEAGCNVLIFLFLLWLFYRKSAAFRSLGSYLVLYGVIRFTLEFFRGDAERGVWLLSTSQWISLLLLPLGLWMINQSKWFEQWAKRIPSANKKTKKSA